MKKIILCIAFALCTSLSFAQESHSLQINGGLLMPRLSSNGFTSSVQYNFKVNSIIQLYFYSGYSSWNQHYISFNVNWTPVQRQYYFSTYSEDNHLLIPFYLGGRFNFHTNKLFTSFLIFEVGYSYLSYNSYTIKNNIEPATG